MSSTLEYVLLSMMFVIGATGASCALLFSLARETKKSVKELVRKPYIALLVGLTAVLVGTIEYLSWWFLFHIDYFF